jgi:nitrogen fixation protein NifU and related proteins
LSSGLRELYQEVLLDHYRRPRNQGPLPAADHTAAGNNPLCGDQVKVALRLEDDPATGTSRVAAIAFEGAGCAISVAAASLMTEAVKGKTPEEAEELFRRFQELVTTDSQAAVPDTDDPLLGKLAIFAGVREFPARVKCATLVWHTLRAALAQLPTPVTTE